MPGQAQAPVFQMPRGFRGRYVFIRTLGAGAFGAVAACKEVGTGKTVAIKVTVYGSTPGEKEAAVNEVNILSQLRHPNLIRLLEPVHEPLYRTVAYSMEFFPGGTLTGYIEIARRNGTTLPETQIFGVLIQVSRLLRCLHTPASRDYAEAGIMRFPVAHRDIKPDNLLIHENRVVVSDYGLSIVLDGPVDLRGMYTGSRPYMAPEIHGGRQYGVEVDLWALGCVLFLMATGHLPFEGTAYMQLKEHHHPRNYRPPRIPEYYSQTLQNIIALLLSWDPHSRPTASQILEAPEVICYVDKLDLVLDRQAFAAEREEFAAELTRRAKISAEKDREMARLVQRERAQAQRLAERDRRISELEQANVQLRADLSRECQKRKLVNVDRYDRWESPEPKRYRYDEQPMIWHEPIIVPQPNAPLEPWSAQSPPDTLFTGIVKRLSKFIFGA